MVTTRILKYELGSGSLLDLVTCAALSRIYVSNANGGNTTKKRTSRRFIRYIVDNNTEAGEDNI